ncbi:cyclin-like protein [Cladochytrium replicatum]|nr:cyclin-like protein [Cladochytrium replicatum]
MIGGLERVTRDSKSRPRPMSWIHSKCPARDENATVAGHPRPSNGLSKISKTERNSLAQPDSRSKGSSAILTTSVQLSGSHRTIVHAISKPSVPIKPAVKDRTNVPRNISSENIHSYSRAQLNNGKEFSLNRPLGQSDQRRGPTNISSLGPLRVPLATISRSENSEKRRLSLTRTGDEEVKTKRVRTGPAPQSMRQNEAAYTQPERKCGGSWMASKRPKKDTANKKQPPPTGSWLGWKGTSTATSNTNKRGTASASGSINSLIPRSQPIISTGKAQSRIPSNSTGTPAYLDAGAVDGGGSRWHRTSILESSFVISRYQPNDSRLSQRFEYDSGYASFDAAAVITPSRPNQTKLKDHTAMSVDKPNETPAELLSRLLPQDIAQKKDNRNERGSDTIEKNPLCDELLLTEYADDIYDYERECEIRTRPLANWADMQNEIDWDMRRMAVEWIIQINNDFYHHRTETIFLAVNIVDRVLSIRHIARPRLQLLCVAAFLLACKREELQTPLVKELVTLCQDQYTAKEIVQGERFALQAVDYDLSYPCPLGFVRRISRADGFDEDVRSLAKYFTEITMDDYRFLLYLPSHIAAAAMFLAGGMMRREWSEEHSRLSGYRAEDLRACVELIWNSVLNHAKHEQVNRKHSKSEAVIWFNAVVSAQ